MLEESYMSSDMFHYIGCPISHHTTSTFNTFQVCIHFISLKSLTMSYIKYATNVNPVLYKLNIIIVN